ncbi:hypothetical protein HHK36_007700 [Tetracentron sinense]|uniref:Exostosin GT47 domain-containing protein n=1 Tax=Tetracentron sinense TaxID=13715 RepID=A0A835DQ28_TETSI|nr:hypothetical protein HHK36_007700 [Tetracentron sinense]
MAEEVVRSSLYRRKPKLNFLRSCSMQQRRLIVVLLLLVAVVVSSWSAVSHYNISTPKTPTFELEFVGSKPLQASSLLESTRSKVNAAATRTNPRPTTKTKKGSRHVQKSGSYHNWELFNRDFEEMLHSFKIFVYPDVYIEDFSSARFARIFRPYSDPFHPKLGNYFSEHMFKIALLRSSMITFHPEEAHFFFMPFSINALRNDPRVHSEASIAEFVAQYTTRISRDFKFWNASGGSDHFYVHCHSVGRDAASKHHDLHNNAIQVACSSSYFQRLYTTHKDVGLPQVWPRPPEKSLNPPDARPNYMHWFPPRLGKRNMLSASTLAFGPLLPNQNILAPNLVRAFVSVMAKHATLCILSRQLLYSVSLNGNPGIVESVAPDSLLIDNNGFPIKLPMALWKRLVFFAGRMQNSQIRQELIATWANDTCMDIFPGNLPFPYEEGFRRSKYCLHVKGYEVNTARISDAIHYGCIPVIVSNHYDLPFANVLDWSKFSVVISHADISLLKQILLSISRQLYLSMYQNLCQVRRHFKWHATPRGYDSFHMTAYQLWVRRGMPSLSS